MESTSCVVVSQNTVKVKLVSELWEQDVVHCNHATLLRPKAVGSRTGSEYHCIPEAIQNCLLY